MLALMLGAGTLWGGWVLLRSDPGQDSSLTRTWDPGARAPRPPSREGSGGRRDLGPQTAAAPIKTSPFEEAAPGAEGRLVLVLDLRGRPVCGALVSLRGVSEQSLVKPEPAFTGVTDQEGSVAVTVLPPPPFKVFARLHRDFGHVLVQARGRGRPRNLSAQVLARVILTPRGLAAALLTGHLVDSEGQSLRDAGFHLAVHWQDRPEFAFPIPGPWFQTDAGGGFSLVFPAGCAGRLQILSLQALAGTGPQLPLTSVPFPALQAHQHLDLGAVLLELAQPLAAGVVVDGQGRPLSGVLVEVFDQVSSTRPPRGSPADSRSSPPGRSLGSFRTRGDGLFRVMGGPMKGLVQVRAVGPEGRAPLRKVTAGVRDLRLVLHHLGGLQGRVVAVHPDLGLRPSLELLPHGRAPGRAGRLVPVKLARGGDFVITGIEPGSYDLILRLADFPPEVISNVHALAGEISAPAAINDFMFGAQLRRVSLRIQTADGQPLSATVLITSRDRRAEILEELSVRNGLASFVLHQGRPISLLVSAPQRVMRFIRRPQFPATITLERGHQVHLVFSQPLPQVKNLSHFRLGLWLSASHELQGEIAQLSAGARSADLAALPAGDFETVLFFKHYLWAGSWGPERSIVLGRLSVQEAPCEPSRQERWQELNAMDLERQIRALR